MLDHDNRGLARDRGDQRLHRGAFGIGQAGERLVEQQHLWLLRQRHRELDAALFAIGDVGHRMVCKMQQADAVQRASRLGRKLVVSGQRPPHLPARPPQTEQSEADIVLQRIVGEQRNDLVGA